MQNTVQQICAFKNMSQRYVNIHECIDSDVTSSKTHARLILSRMLSTSLRKDVQNAFSVRSWTRDVSWRYRLMKTVWAS